VKNKKSKTLKKTAVFEKLLILGGGRET